MGPDDGNSATLGQKTFSNVLKQSSNVPKSIFQQYTRSEKKFFWSQKKIFFLDFWMDNFSRIWKNWSILKTSTFEQLFSKACTSKNMGDMTKIRLETYQGTLKWHNLRFVGSDLDLYFSTSLHGAYTGTPNPRVAV